MRAPDVTLIREEDKRKQLYDFECETIYRLVSVTYGGDSEICKRRGRYRDPDHQNLWKYYVINTDSP